LLGREKEGGKENKKGLAVVVVVIRFHQFQIPAAAAAVPVPQFRNQFCPKR
jgi:hypothetical protein